MFLINPLLFLLLQLKMSAPHYYMYVCINVLFSLYYPHVHSPYMCVM